MANKGKAALGVVGVLLVGYILLARACGGGEADEASAGAEAAAEDVPVVASIPVTVLPVNAAPVIEEPLEEAAEEPGGPLPTYTPQPTYTPLPLPTSTPYPTQTPYGFEPTPEPTVQPAASPVSEPAAGPPPAVEAPGPLGALELDELLGLIREVGAGIEAVHEQATINAGLSPRVRGNPSRHYTKYHQSR